MKKLLLGLCVCALVFAMGDKPSGAVQNKEVLPYEKTASAQFSRAFNEYYRAQQSQYDKDYETAAQSFDYYLTKYTVIDKKADVLYFMSDIYENLRLFAKQETYVNLYFTEAPTENRYMPYAKLSRAALLLNKSVREPAVTDLETLKIHADKNIVFKAYQCLEGVYEQDNNTVALIATYKYFIKNKDLLKNPALYPAYNYKLGMVLYKNKDAAYKGYMQEAASDDSVANRYVREAALKYLK